MLSVKSAGARCVEIARRFFSARDGNVAVIFALAIVPVVVGTGAAVDYSKASQARAAMQGALDSTALTLIKTAADTESDELGTDATKYFTAVFNDSNASNVEVTASYDSSNAILDLNASAYVKTSFMGLAGISKLNITAESKSTLGGTETWPVCVMITNPDSNHTLLVKNEATIDFNNCMVQVNTSNWDAVEARDTSYIHSTNGVNCFVGDIHYGDITPAKEASCDLLSDPYASYVVPTNSCDYTNTVVNANTTLSPGTYCGGITINGSSDVTFSPGIYYIQDGDLQILSESNVTGSGVTFLISGSKSKVKISTTGTITLSPDVDKSAGQWAGFLIFQNPPSSNGGDDKCSDKGQDATIQSATMNVSGTFYFAGEKLNITKGANVTVNPGSIIADFLLPDGGHLTLTGDANASGDANLTKSLASTTPILVK